MSVYRKSFLWVFFAALFYNIGDYAYFMAVATPLALVSLIIPVKRVSTIISTILGGGFFGEKHIFHKAIPAIIMIFGVFFIVQ